MKLLKSFKGFVVSGATVQSYHIFRLSASLLSKCTGDRLWFGGTSSMLYEILVFGG